MSIGNVAFSLQHQSDNCYVVAVNASNVSSFTTPDSSGQRKVCDYFTVLDAAVSLFSLIGGCFMWSVSSGRSFWHHKSICLQTQDKNNSLDKYWHQCCFYCSMKY